MRLPRFVDRYLELPPSTLKKLGWIAVLYFAEGWPFGVAYDLWPVYFRAHGVSLRDLGLMALLFLPYTLKPAWAPLVDRLGSRQVWISSCQFLMAGVVLLILSVDPGRADWLLWGVLLAFTVLSATQDISIDAYSIDVAEPQETGYINGVRASAYRVALIVAGGLILVLVDIPGFGWTGTWIGIALVFVGMGFVTLLSPRREREPVASTTTESGEGGALLRYLVPLRLSLIVATLGVVVVSHLKGWPNLGVILSVVVGALAIASLLDPATLPWLFQARMLPVVVFVVFFKVCDNALGRMVKPFWVDRGFSATEIGLISGALGTGLTIAGALAAGVFIARRGIFQGLLWMGIAQIASNFGYVVVAVFDLPREAIYAASVIESFSQGLGTAAFLSFLMNICDKRHAATQYALLSALFSLSRDVAGAFSGIGAEALGYGGYFALTAFLAVPAMALLPLIRGRIHERQETTPQAVTS